jgi:hypothetical protein
MVKTILIGISSKYHGKSECGEVTESPIISRMAKPDKHFHRRK